MSQGQVIIQEEVKATVTSEEKKSLQIPLWIRIVSVLIMIAAIIIFIALPSHPPRLNPNMSFRTLEIPFTQIYYPGLSRDGSWIAFGACDAKNERSVYFMNVAQGNPRRLTTEPLREIYNADISPDMSEILYDGEPPGKMRGIYVISSAGGVGRKVTEPGTLGKWRPDGQLIGYCLLGRSGVPSQSGKFEFWTVKRDGTENRLGFVDSLSYIWQGLSFDWSPDGNSIAWLRSFPGYHEIFIHDLKLGKERQLTSYKKGIDEVVWASNDQIFFTSNKSGNTNAWMIPVSGGEAVQITKGTGPDLGVRISADGKRLLYMEQRTINHLWTADIDGSNAQQLTFDNQYLEMPSFSPDKKRISFGMWSSDILRPGGHIFIMQSDGTNRTQLTAGDAQYYFAEWSPDGKYMTYASSRIDESVDSSRIYLIEVENPGTPRLVGKGIGVRWINAEKFVTIARQPHTHTTLYSVHSSEPIEASEDSTRQFPLPDGKYIAIWDIRKGREGWWLKAAGVGQTTAPKQILSSEYMSSSFVSVSLRYIMYREANGEMWRVSIPEGKRERLPEILNGINPQGHIQMSFDDKQLVYLKSRVDARLVLIENVFE
jgi:TolB protein